MVLGATYFVLLVDGAHERSCRRQNLIHEDEDGFFRRQLNALTDNIDELTDGEVGGYQVFLLIDSSNVRFLNLLADHLGRKVHVRLLLHKEEEKLGIYFG